MTQRTVHKFPVDRLKLFAGSEEEACDVARADYDQHVVSEILAYRGDPELRSSMTFEVRFADGDVRWLPFSKDLSETQHFEQFCTTYLTISPLLYTTVVAARMRRDINGRPITEISPGDNVFVDIRSFGNPAFYDELTLPDPYHTCYAVLGVYGDWSSAQHKKIEISFPLFKQQFTVDHDYVRRYGSVKVFDVSCMVLVDAAFARTHPRVLA